MSQEISDFRFVCFGIGLIRAKVRTVERSVEGLHSLVKRALQRSPAAKISYLSMELRYPQLLHFAMADPACVGKMSRKMADIVTLRGFRRAILQPDWLQVHHLIDSSNDALFVDSILISCHVAIRFSCREWDAEA